MESRLSHSSAPIGRQTSILSLGFIILLLASAANADQFADFTYTTNGNAITITRYTGTGGSLTIPAAINGLPVVSIGSSAFQSCSGLTDLVIPEGVTNAGSYSFAYCTNLTNALLPATLAKTGPAMFSGCTRLSSVTLPEGTAIISDWTFANCQRLTNLTIPASVTAIDCSAFSGCHSLTEVTLPNKLSTIGDRAFDSCNALTQVQIPASVTNMGEWVFSNCKRLSSIAVEEANAYYRSADGILFDKSGTRLLSCPGGKLGAVTVPVGVTEIGNYSFAVCTGLTTITLSQTLTNIGQYAFSLCTALDHLTIPASVLTIGDRAFDYCTSLTNISVDAANPSYSSSDGILFDKAQTMLIRCPGGKSGNVAVPDNVLTIQNSAFEYCQQLTAVSLPPSLTSIGYKAFWFCTNLASAILPSGLTEIKNSAFVHCISLTSLTIPGSVSNVDDYAFQWCTNLTSVTLSNGVARIGNSAFSHCLRLGSITIPSSVTNIGSTPFTGCTQMSAINVDPANPSYSSVDGLLLNQSLAPLGNIETTLIECPSGIHGTVTVPNGVTRIGQYAFIRCPFVTEVNLPDTLKTIRQQAFSNCASLNQITIPASVTVVENSAFDDCPNLQAVYFRGNQPAPCYSLQNASTNFSVYYLPGTTGWETNFAGWPTTLWKPLIQTPSRSLATNGFNLQIHWATGQPILLEACTNLAQPLWLPLRTFTLTNDSISLNDPDATNHPARFYRVRLPEASD